MKKVTALFLITLLAFPALLFAAQKTIKLTTYYPAPYGDYRNLSSTQGSNFATASGNVGIGTTTPAAKLDVRGQIRSASSNGSVYSTTGVAIDWNNGNVITTSASCGAMTFSNMKEGGAYTLVVTGATSGTCTFNQTDVTSWKFSPTNNATTANKHTVYTFLRVGGTVYVS